MRRFRQLLLLYSLMLTLSSCTSLDKWLDKAPQDAPVQIKPENRWWSVFHDPLMDAFSEDLLKQNLDIKIAETRIAEARGIAKTANSGFFPDISATNQASRSNNAIGVTAPASIVRGGFDTTWELDIFGQTRALTNAADQRVEASVASRDDVVNSVLAELMRGLVELRQAQQTLMQTQALLKAQDEQVELIDTRVRSGLVDASASTRAQAERDQTATQLPLAQAAYDTAEYKIERLLGKESNTLYHAIAQAKGSLTVPSPQDILSISLDTMRTRPDIRIAYAELLAAKADLAKADADFWPRISLSAFFGVQDGSDGLRLANNPIWSLASNISAPLLNFGRLKGAIDSADARSKQALLNYQNAILTALQETKTALSDYLNGVNVVAKQQNAVMQRQRTVKFATERFKHGLTDMTDLTTAQTELNQATLLLTQRQSSAAIAYIRLQKALGLQYKSRVETE